MLVVEPGEQNISLPFLVGRALTDNVLNGSRRFNLNGLEETQPARPRFP